MEPKRANEPSKTRVGKVSKQIENKCQKTQTRSHIVEPEPINTKKKHPKHYSKQNHEKT